MPPTEAYRNGWARTFAATQHRRRKREPHTTPEHLKPFDAADEQSRRALLQSEPRD